MSKESLDEARAWVLVVMCFSAVAIALIIAVAYCHVQPSALVTARCPKCHEQFSVVVNAPEAAK